MGTRQLVQPGVAQPAATDPKALYTGMVTEPTFGVGRPVMLQVTKRGLRFDDPEPLELKRDQVERIELQEWWDTWTRLHLVYRDDEGNHQSRYLVATRLLGPDQLETERLFTVLQKEFGSKAHSSVPTAAATETAPTKKSSAPLGLLVLIALPALCGYLGGIGGALCGLFGAILVLLVPKSGPIWRGALGVTVVLLFTFGAVLVLPDQINPWLEATLQPRAVSGITPPPLPLDDLPLIGKAKEAVSGPTILDRLNAIEQKKQARQPSE